MSSGARSGAGGASGRAERTRLGAASGGAASQHFQLSHQFPTQAVKLAYGQHHIALNMVGQIVQPERGVAQPTELLGQLVGAEGVVVGRYQRHLGLCLGDLALGVAGDRHQRLVVDALEPARVETARESHFEAIAFVGRGRVDRRLGAGFGELLGHPSQCIPINAGHVGNVFRRFQPAFNLQASAARLNQGRQHGQV